MEALFSSDFYFGPEQSDRTITLEKKEYEISADQVIPEWICVSNCLGEEEKFDNTRHFGIYLKDVEELVLDGNGACIRSAGKMTQLGIRNCKNITIKNITFEYTHPTVTEMTVTAIGEKYVEFTTTDPYRICHGRLEWLGENWSFTRGISQIFRPSTGMTWRSWEFFSELSTRWTELSQGHIRMDTLEDNPQELMLGDVLQMRNPIRDECGIMVSDSNNVKLENVTIHYAHGLGFVAQNTEHIEISGMTCIPSEGRTCACFADFLQFSGCRGHILVQNSTFCGAHDDAINVHGTHLQVMERTEKELLVKFMHPQSYGFRVFEEGDIIAAIDPKTLCETGQDKVMSVEEISPYLKKLVLEKGDPAFQKMVCIENVSATPSVEIRNNSFDRVPTRGILMTTRGKVLIENNHFIHIPMSGVHISDDARSWYESGCVRDVTIHNNLFEACPKYILSVLPECENPNQFRKVHKNIRFTGNRIISEGQPAFIKAMSTDGIRIVGNTVVGKDAQLSVDLIGCINAVVSENSNLYNT